MLQSALPAEKKICICSAMDLVQQHRKFLHPRKLLGQIVPKLSELPVFLVSKRHDHCFCIRMKLPSRQKVFPRPQMFRSFTLAISRRHEHHPATCQIRPERFHGTEVHANPISLEHLCPLFGDRPRCATLRRDNNFYICIGIEHFYAFGFGGPSSVPNVESSPSKGQSACTAEEPQNTPKPVSLTRMYRTQPVQ